MSVRRRAVAGLVAVGIAGLAAASPLSAGRGAASGLQQPASPPPVAGDVDRILAAARGYLDEYARALSLVVGVERYAQWVVDSEAQVAIAQGGDRPAVRNTVSEFALVRADNDWIGYRDVLEVDGKALRDRQDRLQRLFIEDQPSARAQARKIADESARFNAGAMQRNFNVPTMALYFLQSANAARFRHQLDGYETLDGVRVARLRFQESRKPTIIRTPSGGNMPVGGTVWIEPGSGRILKTFMEITGEVRLTPADSQSSRGGQITARTGDFPDRVVPTFARVTVRYTRDEKLGLLLPTEMAEEYQSVSAGREGSPERVQRIRCRASYSDYKRFETSGRVIVRAPND
jgi:hypothetical protein